MTVKRRLRSREASEKLFVAVVFVFFFFSDVPHAGRLENKKKKQKQKA